MRIGLETSGLSKPNTGVHTYAMNLLHGLVGLKHDDHFVLLCRAIRWRANLLPPEARTSNVTPRVWRLPGRALQWTCRNAGWPKAEGLMGRVDLFHLLDAQFLRAGKSKTLVTIHDVIPFRFPELFGRHSARYHQERISYSVTHSDAIIAGSESTKHDLVELLGLDPNRIHVVYYGVDTNVWRPQHVEAVQDTAHRFGLRLPYVLSVGVLEPRKNYVRLIRAFSSLDVPHQLVIVGKKGWVYDPILAEAQKSSRSEAVRFIHDATLPELSRLVAGASVFLYPSLYEGFGLPPLEAMAVGVPVVVSDCSSLPEVVGDAGVLVDPLDLDSIASGISEALTMNDAERERRVDIGRRRAAEFSWQRTAQETRSVYEALIG